MKTLLALFLLISCSFTVVAQSNLKEGNNSFALYTKTGDTKHLDNARRLSDATFATRKDSAQLKNNILRALIYSSYAVVDSLRKQKYSADPIDIAQAAMNLIQKRRGRDEFKTEGDYVKQNLVSALIFRANKSLAEKKYKDAYLFYEKVNILNGDSLAITSNMAVLAVQIKDLSKAEELYQRIIKSEKETAYDYLQLAHVYTLQGKKEESLSALIAGKQQFSRSKEILFQLVQHYADNKAYDKVIDIIDEAITYEPENIQLNYLAGYAYESLGNIVAAKDFYEKVIKLDENNYQANLALGLAFFKDFLTDKANNEKRIYAQNYLLKANEIKPYDVNALQSLAFYYTATEDMMQLDRVNSLLNQLNEN